MLIDLSHTRNWGVKGLGVVPTPYPVIQQPSTDYAVYSTSNPQYIYNLNLQAAQQQANRTNATLNSLGRSDFVTVDEIAFRNWWNSFPNGPGSGNPPQQNFWIGLNPNDNISNYIGVSVNLPVGSDAQMVTTEQQLASINASYANQVKQSGAGTPYIPSNYNGPGYGQVSGNRDSGPVVKSGTPGNQYVYDGITNTVNALSQVGSSLLTSVKSVTGNIPTWALVGGGLALIYLFTRGSR